MAELNYPDAEAHVNAHNRFREELHSMVETRGDMDRLLQESLSSFLSKWLKLHVLGIDKKLEKFMLESKVK